MRYCGGSGPTALPRWRSLTNLTAVLFGGDHSREHPQDADRDAAGRNLSPFTYLLVVVVDIMIGLVTPPYRLLLFLMSKIAEVPLRDLVRDAMPVPAVMVGALALLTFVPRLVFFLPRRMGDPG